MLLRKVTEFKVFSWSVFFTVLELNAEVQRKFPYSNRPKKTQNLSTFHALVCHLFTFNSS